MGLSHINTCAAFPVTIRHYYIALPRFLQDKPTPIHICFKIPAPHRPLRRVNHQMIRLCAASFKNRSLSVKTNGA